MCSKRYSATLPTNTRSVVAELSGVGRYGVVNDPTSASAITAGGHSIPPGGDYILAPPGVGGVSEPPGSASLPAATESSDGNRGQIAIGAAIAIIVMAAAGGWQLRRRLRLVG